MVSFPVSFLDFVNTLIVSIKHFTAAPWILNIVFPTIKRIIRGATMDKLKIFDGNADNFLPALVDAVPPSGFPQGFKKYHGKLFETWCSANI